jgi:hypothetical protein
MARLRRKQKPPLPAPEAALCTHEFRPGAVAPVIRRGQQLPLNHHAVVAFPEYFVGVVPLKPNEVTTDAE